MPSRSTPGSRRAIRSASSRHWVERWPPLDTSLRKELRSLEIADEPHPEALLGRFVDRVRADEFAQYIEGATVLITGAAGFLGSRLAERVARLQARTVVLADSAEAAVIDLAVTLARSHGLDAAVPVLADIRNRACAAELVARHSPNVVFHAAGYKHVPLLEAHPVEAVATNVLGTKNMVEAALAAGVERFVSFSTDKAVRPTNVLGQTKAAAEWIVSSWGDEARGRRYSSIRLANVVDATGGILPRFRGQIERGGPLTVTDPRATRLLMTSTEAVGLALVAGAVGDPGGAFWLDVGPPVRILDLGRRVAEGREIDIELIGLRPGENLHEESFSEDGESSPTPCRGVFRTALPRIDPTWLHAWISELADFVGRASDERVRAALAAPHALRAGELATSAAGAR